MTIKTPTLLSVATLLLIALAFTPFEYSGIAEATRKTMDAGHFIAFGLFALLLHPLFSSHGNKVATIITFTICALLIVSIEFIQPYVGRTASLTDVINGFLGMAVFLSGRYLWCSTKRPHIKYIHALLGTLIFTAVASPALSEWHAVWWRMKHFPILGDFEENIELQVWRAHGKTGGQQTRNSLSKEYVTSGEAALKIETIPGDWSGVRYAAGDKNWSTFRSLNMDIYNPGEPFTLTLRIDDNRTSPDHHERFNARIKIASGWNHEKISLASVADGPETGKLNMQAIHQLILFSGRKEPVRLFYLDHLRLE